MHERKTSCAVAMPGERRSEGRSPLVHNSSFTNVLWKALNLGEGSRSRVPGIGAGLVVPQFDFTGPWRPSLVAARLGHVDEHTMYGAQAGPRPPLRAFSWCTMLHSTVWTLASTVTCTSTRHRWPPFPAKRTQAGALVASRVRRLMDEGAPLGQARRPAIRHASGKGSVNSSHGLLRGSQKSS